MELWWFARVCVVQSWQPPPKWYHLPRKEGHESEYEAGLFERLGVYQTLHWCISSGQDIFQMQQTIRIVPELIR